MKLYRTPSGPILERNSEFVALTDTTWDDLLARENLYEYLHSVAGETVDAPDELLAPVGDREVWAAGVTYLRSREARMEESKDAGGGDFYSRVYSAARPELFFKSAGFRVVGLGGEVRTRRDASWTVPEPELVLAISPAGQIYGYTIGNDMSSRDIEGENPLYLPQAKTYNGSCAVGPCIYVTQSPLAATTEIGLEIVRDHSVVFEDAVEIGRIKRPLTELAEYLYRELAFPGGAFLMTGTGIVPPDDFTLISGDRVTITIQPIGSLTNIVA